jgi:hypothetical protein
MTLSAFNLVHVSVNHLLLAGVIVILVAVWIQTRRMARLLSRASSSTLLPQVVPAFMTAAQRGLFTLVSSVARTYQLQAVPRVPPQHLFVVKDHGASSLEAPEPHREIDCVLLARDSSKPVAAIILTEHASIEPAHSRGLTLLRTLSSAAGLPVITLHPGEGERDLRRALDRLLPEQAPDTYVYRLDRPLEEIPSTTPD